MIGPEDDWKELESFPVRRHCKGHPMGVPRCGLSATVVCTELLLSTRKRPLRWYACGLPSHQAGATTEPIESFLERCVRHLAVEILSQGSP
jgi:hypothetical protein